MKGKDTQFLEDIKYFWEYKGDITRYIDFDRERLKRLAPHILLAWDSYLLHKFMLDSFCKD